MRIKFQKLKADAVLPRYAHGPTEDAGMDLFAALDDELVPGLVTYVGTGLAVEIPVGYELQIRPRSGLANKHKIIIPNAPGTIDPGYRGEIRVALLNLGDRTYRVHQGDRIAQVVLARYETMEWEEETLTESVRSTGGFGSSGR